MLDSTELMESFSFSTSIVTRQDLMNYFVMDGGKDNVQTFGGSVGVQNRVFDVRVTFVCICSKEKVDP